MNEENEQKNYKRMLDQLSCKHEWENEEYDPDLFDGMDRWYYTCRLCGKRQISFQRLVLKVKTLENKK